MPGPAIFTIRWERSKPLDAAIVRPFLRPALRRAFPQFSGPAASFGEFLRAGEMAAMRWIRARVRVCVRVSLPYLFHNLLVSSRFWIEKCIGKSFAYWAEMAVKRASRDHFCDTK